MPLRILLITPQFYGIEKIIKSVLEELNYEVTWLENKILPFDWHGAKSKFKLLRKIYFLLLSPHIRYLRKELKKINNPEFDIIFSINAHIICSYLFRKLKSKNPRLYAVLYLWDAFAKYDWTKELRHFNEVFTFDPADALKYKLKYKPNFYIKSNISTNHENEYDLFFAGKFSPERIKLIDKLMNQADSAGISFFVKLWPAYKILLHNRFIYSFIRAFKINIPWTKSYILNYEAVAGILKREYMVRENLNFRKLQPVLLCSNVVLDLPYERQTGYTHRVIEALSNGKKIITTNSNIKKESFYNQNQFHFLDEKNPEIDTGWIKEKSVFPVSSFFSDLELSRWLKSVINVGIA